MTWIICMLICFKNKNYKQLITFIFQTPLVKSRQPTETEGGVDVTSTKSKGGRCWQRRWNRRTTRIWWVSWLADKKGVEMILITTFIPAVILCIHVFVYPLHPCRHTFRLLGYEKVYLPLYMHPFLSKETIYYQWNTLFFILECFFLFHKLSNKGSFLVVPMQHWLLLKCSWWKLLLFLNFRPNTFAN